ncbi:MAG: polysaccharide deacetylase family protein [Bacteroidota bacterium]
MINPLLSFNFVLNLQLLIRIYSQHISAPRLLYILQELFIRRLGMDYQLTDNLDDFQSYSGPKINYSHHECESAIQIVPHAIITEEHINNHVISVKHHHVWDTLMLEQQGEIPFELFAASFYLLSRYEEYLPHKVDDHGRFEADQSLAVQYGFIETPLIDKWALQLKIVLENHFGRIQSTMPTYRFVSTFDIDTAYLYKGLEQERQLKKLVKSISFLNVTTLAEQYNVRKGKLRDPYDTYRYIAQVTNNCNVLYFILSGGEHEYDELIPIKTPEMQSLLKSLSKEYTLGLHPSYLSFDSKEIIEHEKQILESSIQQQVIINRQHFLRFRLPQTMNLLIESGIREDYSMAYSEIAGFRASTAHPFRFFDLEQNIVTELLLYPTTLMDVTLRFSMNLTIHAAITKAEQLIQEVKLVNGVFVSLWHNSNLSATNEWLPWKEVFEKIHTLASDT